MVNAQPENQVKSDESLVRQIENEPNSTEVIEKNEETRLNEQEVQPQETCSDGLKRKTKRKKSTSIDGIGVENDTNDIEYAIVEHENKRQKIEIRKHKENNQTSIKADGLHMDKPPAKQPKDAKPNAETNKLRLKYENIHANTVQKLNAQAKQLRLEISTLRTALANEQNAVRVLRAQNDANFRKEKIHSLKWRGDKQTGASLKQQQRSADRTSASTPVTMSQNSQLSEQSTRIDRLLKEIEALKETNKQLAEQAQKSSKAERRKISDIRQLKDEYEHRLSQAEKASKVEINRLLEEIKSNKQTAIILQKQAQLRKHDKHSMSKMRKKETESCDSTTISNESNLTNTKMTTTTNNEITTNQTKQTIATHDSTTQTTCKEDLFTMPHEIRERIMNVQNELQYCKSKDLSGSDNDSALSSAPPSLSPQPGTQSNSPDVWQTLLKDFKEHESLQKEYELIKEENQFLNCEISMAEEQIRELEKVLQMTRENHKHDELLERIHQLECKEAIILKESHELREQNELLEFRIIELEEGADKLLNSGNFNNKRDAYTEADLAAATNETPSSTCICNANSQEQMPTDNVRKTLLTMSKHSCFDEQGRQCLLQVVSLLNNLETMSQDDHEFSLDDDHFSSMNEKLTRFYSPDHTKSSPMASAQSSPMRNYDRIVACVPPYTSHQIDDTVSGHKLVVQKLSSSHSFTSSMNESGVFDGDSTLPITDNQGTQTNFDDFPLTDELVVTGCANSDLCAEIQKLNKFRKKIEECSMNSPSLDIGVLSPLSKLDETRLQYYRDRLDMLENKVAIYESSGDAQLRRLAGRLQNEIQLDAQVKLLKQRVEKLESTNRQLDEERCELEEIENDTRLQLQRLEVDLEMLTQRNSELEMSCETAQANAECLQESINQLNEQMLLIDADRNDLYLKLELISAFMPAILLYHAWQMQQYQPRALTDPQMAMNETTERLLSPSVQIECVCNKEHICPDSDKFLELVRREQELTGTIAEMNRAYNETLERADNLWAQMEREYKDKLNRSQEDNTLLRSKINQLEKRLKNDAHYAQERIAQLEDEENVLKRRLAKLNRISRDEADKYKALQGDFHSLSSEYEKLKTYMDGPLSETIEKERKKARTMEEEMRMASKMYNDLEQLHRTQMNLLKTKLEKCKKDLMTSEINNSELKEEVVQLEHKVIELNRCRREDEDRIKTLAAEAHEQHTVVRPIKPIRIKHNSRNLAQELGSFGRNNGLNAINNLNYTSVYTLNSVASKVSETIKNFEVNREPIRHQFE
ncbi:centromere protein F isoform X2 [Sitodiplosis mosellana]|uniref:centromere protein F isoform X2 n=1 Tax=Sitodiplosis mosellana TaxID=263140 RepID=UPI00244431EB|nr:centromere protein F isoform X2 [Sitodiplosis mosellana]